MRICGCSINSSREARGWKPMCRLFGLLLSWGWRPAIFLDAAGATAIRAFSFLRHSRPPSFPRFRHSRLPSFPRFRHSRLPSFSPSVIPAKAGIHTALPRKFVIWQGVVDSRFRGNDGNHASQTRDGNHASQPGEGNYASQPKNEKALPQL